MAKYIVQEIKETVIKAEVEAEYAQKAIMNYKNRHARVSGTSEETHITVEEMKEEK